MARKSHFIAEGTPSVNDAKSTSNAAYSVINAAGALVPVVSQEGAWIGVGSPTGDITAVTAGAGLTGGGTSGAVTLNVANTDGKITVGADSIDITADSLVNADINSAAAIAWSKMAALTSNYILAGVSNVPTVCNVAGDIAMTAAGTTATFTVTDLTISSEAQGDILYRNATNWVRLAAGTSGQGLVTAGPGSNPYWGSPSVATASVLANNVTCEAGANDYTLDFGTAGGAYTLTIPAVGGSRTFAFINEDQTISGANTYSGNQTMQYGKLYLGDNDNGQTLQILVNENMTGDKTLTIKPNDANREIDLSGNISLGGTLTTLAAWTQTGAHTIDVTTTGNTALTLPTSGTLATLAGTESLSNKTLAAVKIATGDGIFDAGGDELLLFTEDTTPVNYIMITSADTNVAPMITADGSDADIDLMLHGKGTGNVVMTDAGDITTKVIFEIDGATADKEMTLTFSHTDDRALTFPDATDTLVGKATTDVFTNKSYDCDGTGNVLTNLNADELDPITMGASTYGVPFVITYTLTNQAAAVNIFNANAPFKFRIIGAYSVATSADGGTWKLNNGAGGGGTDITDVVTVAASDKDIDRAAELDDAAWDIAASGSLSIVPDGGGALDCIIFVECMRVD